MEIDIIDDVDNIETIGSQQLPPRVAEKNYKILLPFIMIGIAEILVYLKMNYYAILLHVIIVIGLAIATSSQKNMVIRNAYQALMLLPILRLLTMSMPVFFNLTLFSFIFVYTPMFISLHLLIKHQGITQKELGIDSKHILIYLILSLIIGAMIAQAEYTILSPEYLIPDLSIINLIGLTIIMMFFVGLVEELIFRAVLQTRLEEAFGMFFGLVFTSILFGIMQAGYGNIDEMLLMSFIGFIVGGLFQKTRSLPLVTMIHGFTNIFLFGVIPHLGTGMGLF